MDEHDPFTDEIDLSKMVKHVIAVLPFEVSEMEVPWPWSYLHVPNYPESINVQ